MGSEVFGSPISKSFPIVRSAREHNRSIRPDVAIIKLARRWLMNPVDEWDRLVHTLITGLLLNMGTARTYGAILGGATPPPSDSKAKLIPAKDLVLGLFSKQIE
jgi:hypothetical protein